MNTPNTQFCLLQLQCSFVASKHRPCVQPLSTLIGGSQHPHTAPRTTNQTDRHTRKPNQCTPMTGHTARRPYHHATATQEHTTVNRAPGYAISAPATQRAHHAHIHSNASPNSVTTRPSLREPQHSHRTHTPLIRRPQRKQS